MVTPIRRGPGRPRLKPTGPGNQGFRIVSRPKKSVGPLVVPLGTSPMQTPTMGRSPAMSPAPSSASSSHERSVNYHQHTTDDDY